MASPLPTFTLEYSRLRKAAEAFGFRGEASHIARRAEDLGHPFMLFVMGEPGSGKSALINQILGRSIAPVGRPMPWLSIYRTPDGDRSPGHEYAEVYMRDRTEPPGKIPVSQAQALARANMPTFPGESSNIERIVWYINSPEFAWDVALAEPPHVKDRIPEQYFWQADGLIWMMRADTLNDQKTSVTLATMQQQRVLPVMTMGVLSHMNDVPRKKWLAVLQEARSAAGAELDVVVPWVMEPDEIELASADTNAILKREVRNRFFASAQSVQRQNQALFIDAMTRRLSGRFETFVDRALANRWACRRFQAALDKQFDDITEHATIQVQGFVQELSDYTLARAADIEQNAPGGHYLQRSFGPPPSIDAFFARVTSYVRNESLKTYAGLEFDGESVARLEMTPSTAVMPADGVTGGAPPAISFKVPDPPVSALLDMIGMREGGETGVEASVYPYWGDGGQAMVVSEPVHADLWQSAKDWLPAMAAQAELESLEWLHETLGVLKQGLVDCAEQTYRSLHGFLPSDAPIALAALEETYEELTGHALRVPTPHLPGQGLSPALFLCRLQEDAFIDMWNRRLVSQCFDHVVPRIHEQMVREIELVRRKMIDQWEEARTSVHKRVEIVWSRYGRRLALKNAVKWSIPWVASLMRDRLMDPVQYLGRRRLPVELPPDYAVSLFLGTEPNAFLQPLNKPVDPPFEPARFIEDKLTRTVKRTASKLWRNAQSIQVPMELRTVIRRRTAYAGGMVVGFSLLWMMLFGSGTVSMLSLTVILIPYVIVTAISFKRLIDRTYDSGSETQAERVFTHIAGRVNDRLNGLKRAVDDTVYGPEFREDIEVQLSNHQAKPGATFLSYHDLVQRLRATQG